MRRYSLRNRNLFASGIYPRFRPEMLDLFSLPVMLNH